MMPDLVAGDFDAESQLSEKTPAATAGPTVFWRLIEGLPKFAREELLQRSGGESALLDSPKRLFDQIESWLVGAGIAEGRGGYPGVNGAPGHDDYVCDVQKYLAIYRALIGKFGEVGNLSRKDCDDYERDEVGGTGDFSPKWLP